MKKISFVLSILLCFVLILGPVNILKDTIFPKTIHSAVTRLHANTGNTTRISVSNPQELAINISDILYPSIDKNSSPNGVIIVQGYEWRDILSLLPLVKKYNSPIIPVTEEISDELVSKYLKDSAPIGIPELNGAQLILISKKIDNLSDLLKNSNYKKKFIPYSSTEDLQDKLSALPKYLDGIEYGFIINEDDPLLSIPVGTWIVNNDNIIPFFTNDKGEIYKSSSNIILNSKVKKLFAVGSKEKLNNVSVKNIDIEYILSDNPEKLSVEFAKYFDEDTLVGWDATRERRDSGHNFILASKTEPLMGLIGSQLALKGKIGPLLWTDKQELSPIIEEYLWYEKPNFWITPAEGPFNHIWILGDSSILNYGIQGIADYTQEIAPYEMMAEGGVSGLDLLSILWIIASLGSALWVTFHLFFRMNSLFLLVKMMWILITILLGPIGLWLYVISYKDRPWMKMMGNVMWKRPLWNQVAVATIMGLSFGGATMIATAYIISSFGMPLTIISSPKLFLFGNPMIVQMIIVYIVAFILNVFIFMPTMLMKMSNVSYNIGIKKAFPIVLISMTSVSLGMMISMWWLHMVYSPMMPEESHILWWGFMYLSTLIGGLTAYIPNWKLVRYGKKMGVS